MTCEKTGCGCGDKPQGTVQKLKDLAQRFYNDPEGAAHEVGKDLRDLLNSANGDLHEVSDKVTTHVREKPVESSLIALGIGLVAGLFMRRR